MREALALADASLAYNEFVQYKPNHISGILKWRLLTTSKSKSFTCVCRVDRTTISGAHHLDEFSSVLNDLNEKLHISYLSEWRPLS